MFSSPRNTRNLMVGGWWSIEVTETVNSLLCYRLYLINRSWKASFVNQSSKSQSMTDIKVLMTPLMNIYFFKKKKNYIHIFFFILYEWNNQKTP